MHRRLLAVRHHELDRGRGYRILGVESELERERLALSRALVARGGVVSSPACGSSAPAARSGTGAHLVQRFAHDFDGEGPRLKVVRFHEVDACDAGGGVSMATSEARRGETDRRGILRV